MDDGIYVLVFVVRGLCVVGRRCGELVVERRLGMPCAVFDVGSAFAVISARIPLVLGGRLAGLHATVGVLLILWA